MYNKKSSPKAAHSQNSVPSKNILTDIMFYCFKFLPVGVIPARSTADGIEEAVHAYMNVGILLGEVALNAGEKYKERVIALYVLACYMHAHCLAEHLVEVA